MRFRPNPDATKSSAQALSQRRERIVVGMSLYAIGGLARNYASLTGATPRCGKLRDGCHRANHSNRAPAISRALTAKASSDHVSILTMNGDSYRLKQSSGGRRTASNAAEQNRATETADPDTDEMPIS